MHLESGFVIERRGGILRRFRLLKILIALILIGMAPVLNSCTREPPEKGILEVRIKDHREAIDDFAKLDIFIEAVRLKPWSFRPWGGWIDLKPDLANFDLTAYTRGNSLTVYKGDIESGPFEGFRLTVGKIDGVLKKNNASVRVKNEVGPIQVSFSLEPKKVTQLTLDLKVLDLSDHAGRGYELHVNGYEHTRDGKVVEKVPPG
jgi:hypothetical protein